MLLPDCLFHVTFRYSPLRLEVVENRTIVKVPSFLGEGDQRRRLFYGIMLARFIIHRLAKFGSVPFADLCLQSLAMKQNAEFTVKMQVEF